jgi:ribosomal protein S18 acetylase RimI-like enzyme
MNDPDRISFTEKLDAWTRQRFSIDKSVKRVTYLNRVGCVECRRDPACDLYLRLWQPAFRQEDGHWPAKTLVIARMEFANTRSGHGGALLDFLVQQADVYGYEKIALEHTHNGDDIQGFARKFGFEYAWPDLDPPQRNWIASVALVAERLDPTIVCP